MISSMADEVRSLLTAALRDRYDVQRELGRGGASFVYLAQDLDPNLLQGPTHLLNLRLGLRSANQRWEGTFWVTNAADQRWFVTGFDVPVLSGFAGVLAPPRQFGFTLRFRI